VERPAAILSATDEYALRDAFSAVLLALPQRHFQRFMDLDPHIICLDAKGMVFNMVFAVPPGAKEVKPNFIFISPVLHKNQRGRVNTCRA